MSDLFALNYDRSNYNTVKKETRKGVQHVAGEHMARSLMHRLKFIKRPKLHTTLLVQFQSH